YGRRVVRSGRGAHVAAAFGRRSGPEPGRHRPASAAARRCGPGRDRGRRPVVRPVASGGGGGGLVATGDQRHGGVVAHQPRTGAGGWVVVVRLGGALFEPGDRTGGWKAGVALGPRRPPAGPGVRGGGGPRGQQRGGGVAAGAGGPGPGRGRGGVPG